MSCPTSQVAQPTPTRFQPMPLRTIELRAARKQAQAASAEAIVQAISLIQMACAASLIRSNALYSTRPSTQSRTSDQRGNETFAATGSVLGMRRQYARSASFDPLKKRRMLNACQGG